MKRCCSIVFFILAAGFSAEAFAQTIEERLEQILPGQEAQAAVISPADSVSDPQLKYLTHSSTYRLAKKHPYFRDEFKVIRDLRRLVQFVEPRGHHGYESIRDLVSIANSLPLEKQTAIARTALLGSTAEILSGITNRQLRKRKLSFLRWRLDQVEARRSLHRHLSFRLYQGINGSGAQFYLPQARIMYAWYFYETYALQGPTYWLTRKFAMGYRLGEDRQIFNSMVIPASGCLVYVEYYRQQRYITSYIELRRFTLFNLRFSYYNQLKRQRSWRFRSEILWQLW